eukprot:3882747-Amphidinium_carterae.4
MDDDPPIDPSLIPRPREEGEDEVPEDVGQEEEGPIEKEIPEPKMARESRDVDPNQGRKPDWWPVDRPFYPGCRSARALWHSTPQHAEHQRRRELGLLTKEWLLQLKKWHEEGKDVDIIYDPRPKDPSFPPKPSGAESSGSGGPIAAIEVVDCQVTMPIAEVTRNIIEFCCDDDSSLGKACPKGCKVMRITKGMDASHATKSTTVEKAMSAIEGENTMVWGSIPCTGGTPWRRINDAKHGDDPEYKKKMRDHERRFDKLWYNFVQVAEHCASAGGMVAMEWPTSCSYWQKARVKRFLKRNNMKKVDFHGCSVGVQIESLREADQETMDDSNQLVRAEECL